MTQGAQAGFDVGTVRAAATQMRRDILSMLEKAGSGHPGGSLSATDMIATLYFGGVLRHTPADPARADRDRFILSKGHAAPALYAVLAQAGYFPQEWLDTLRKLGSHLQGHPDMRKCPGVEISTGSLGQGLAAGAGMAMAIHQDWSDIAAGVMPVGRAEATLVSSEREPQIFVMMGDGELQEGEVWESAMFAASRELPNLVAIVDLNQLQIDGPVDSVVTLGGVGAKFAAFGWHVIDVADGNDVQQCYDALQQAVAWTQGPAVLISHTVKGKGVSFMEGQVGWHGKAPNAEQLQEALAQIEAGHRGIIR